MPWMPAPSICACRFSPGHPFARPKRLSSCTRSWTCAATSLLLHISDGKLHDVNVLDLLLPESGAFYIMDRGYIDFERLHHLHEAGSFFVTRAKSNLKAQRRYSHPVDRSTGLICDQTIVLSGFYSETAPYQRPRDRQTSQRACMKCYLTEDCSIRTSESVLGELVDGNSVLGNLS